MRMRAVALLLALLGALPAAAQTGQFPQTMPANTVYGRLGVNAGPGQAIPFLRLTAALPLSLASGRIYIGNSSNVAVAAQLTNDCSISYTSSAIIVCTKTNGVAFGPFATSANAANLTGFVSTARGGFGIDVSAGTGIPVFAAGIPTITTTLPAVTLGGTVTGGGNPLTGIGGINSDFLSVVGTGGAGFIGLTGQSVNTGTPAANNVRIFGDATGRFSWKRDDGFVRTFASTLTADRVYIWPDANGTVALTAGATIPTIAQGDLLYGSAANTLSALAKDTGTSRFLKNSGTSNNPAWARPACADLSDAAASCSTDATNATNISTGSLALARITQGTNGQLIVGQTSAAPAWTTMSGDCTLAAAGAITCTKVNGVTYPSSMTSGGILYASSTSAVASSALLAANQIVLGGGAGTTPATLGSLGTSSTVLHGNASGAPSFSSVVSSDLNITTTTCTNQFVTAISAGGVGTCTTDTLAGAQHANQGTTTTVLHGNASGNPSWGAVSLTADVSGTLPAGNGGTGITALGTGVSTALGTNVGLVGAFAVVGGVLGSPSSVGTMPAFTLGGAITTGGNTAAGLGKVPPWQGGYAAGRYYVGNIGALVGTVALAANTVYYCPIQIGETHTFDRIAAQVTTTGTAANIRLAIYNAAGGIPTSLVVDGGSVAAGSTGFKTVTISQSLSPGVYYLAIVADGTVTVNAMNTAGTAALMFTGVTDFVTPDSQMNGALTFGAFPSTAGAPSYSNAFTPTVGVRG